MLQFSPSVSWVHGLTSLPVPKDLESVCVYVIRCKAKAAECKFSCPHCARSLNYFMLSKKLVVQLADICMKTEVLQHLPQLHNADDVIRVFEIYEPAEKSANVRRDVVEATASVLQGPPSPSWQQVGGAQSLPNLTKRWLPSDSPASKVLRAESMSSTARSHYHKCSSKYTEEKKHPALNTTCHSC